MLKNTYILALALSCCTSNQFLKTHDNVRFNIADGKNVIVYFNRSNIIEEGLDNQSLDDFENIFTSGLDSLRPSVKFRYVNIFTEFKTFTNLKLEYEKAVESHLDPKFNVRIPIVDSNNSEHSNLDYLILIDNIWMSDVSFIKGSVSGGGFGPGGANTPMVSTPGGVKLINEIKFIILDFKQRKVMAYGIKRFPEWRALSNDFSSIQEDAFKASELFYKLFTPNLPNPRTRKKGQ